jgi:hypothetical protein
MKPISEAVLQYVQDPPTVAFDDVVQSALGPSAATL